jgi:hypothetical protein
MLRILGLKSHQISSGGFRKALVITWEAWIFFSKREISLRLPATSAVGADFIFDDIGHLLDVQRAALAPSGST